jgi:hypothetical protein
MVKFVTVVHQYHGEPIQLVNNINERLILLT